MILDFLFARRYLFGKKSTNAINIITGITVGGVALGTAALIIILSVFNGFGDLVGNLFNAFNPDIKITAVKGKGFHPTPQQISDILQIDGVKQVSRTMEEKVLLEYRDVQDVGTVKAVDDHFTQVTSIDSTLRGGYYSVKMDGPPRAVLGAGLARRMSVNTADVFTSLKVYLPKEKKALSMDRSFVSKGIQPTGVFSFQQEYDFQYVIAPLSFLQELTGREDIGALEISVHNLDQLADIKTELLGI